MLQCVKFLALGSLIQESLNMDQVMVMLSCICSNFETLLNLKQFLQV